MHSGFELIESIPSIDSSSLQRAIRREDGQRVVLRRVDTESVHERLRCRNEFGLLREVRSPFLVRALELLEEPNACTLVLEDFGGAPLPSSHLLGRLPVEGALELGARLIDAVAAVHERRLIHRRVAPQSFWSNAHSGEVRLSNFSEASQLTRQTLARAALVATGLTYAAPEQTGRVNRRVDYRSDYYSLGATLYELFAGRPPFVCDDLLELADCHVTRIPEPLDRVAGAPAAVSDIVAKLLAKEPADRYQSAEGLSSDWLRCVRAFRSGRPGTTFSLGTQERATELNFPQTLFGRERELALLRSCWEELHGRGGTLIWIEGEAGVGKSVLAREAYSASTWRNGYLAVGKFDQNASVGPYAALLEALRSLLRQILTEPETDLASWRAHFATQLKVPPSVLAASCRELALLLELDPSAPEAESSSNARDRFHQAVREFVQAIVDSGKALCLLIEDLQWADAESLELFAELLQLARTQPLLLVATSRPVDRLNPVRNLLEKVTAQGNRLERVALQALGVDDVAQLLSVTLERPRDEVSELARVLQRRTEGNPFFLRAFLTNVYRKQVLYCSDAGWRWELEGIRQEGAASSAVGVLQAELGHLPPASREALLWAACLGGSFLLDQLRVVSDLPDAGDLLWPAIELELLLPPADVQSPLQLSPQVSGVEIRFTHDQIQQAILDSVDGADRQRRHWHIGTCLTRTERGDELAIRAATHLNLGAACAKDSKDLLQLAQVNARAADSALHHAAAAQALHFAQAAISALTPQRAVPSNAELLLRVHRTALRAAFQAGQFELMESLAESSLSYCRRRGDRALIHTLRGHVHYTRQRAADALHAYIEALAMLGVLIDEQPPAEALARARDRLAELDAGHDLQAVALGPRCREPDVAEALEVFDQALMVAFYASHPVFPLLIVAALELSIEHGSSQHTASCFMFYGLSCAARHEYARAARFGELALRTAEHFGDRSVLSRTLLYAHFQLLHWTTPLPELSGKFQQGYEAGAAVGAPFNTACNATSHCINRLFAGEPLRPLLEDMRAYALPIRQLGQDQVMTWHQVHQQTAANFAGASATPSELCGEIYDERSQVPVHVAGNDYPQLFNYRLCKSFLLCWFGAFAEALPYLRESTAFFEMVAVNTITCGTWILVDSICHLRSLHSLPETEREPALERVASHEARIERWREFCPATWDHKLALLRAERVRAQGEAGAGQHYALALELARKSPYLHEHALVSELAGRAALEREELDAARSYLREAEHCYQRWGAEPKLAQVRALQAELGAASVPSRSPAPAADYQYSDLDLSTALKASQAISSEISAEGLFVRLTELAIETAGANSGALLLLDGSRWTVEAERSPGEIAVRRVRLSADALIAGPAGGSSEPQDDLRLSAAIIRYVLRTNQCLVLEDACGHPEFRFDRAVQQHAVKSVLCFPIRQQSATAGVLYLENSLVRGAFTPERVAILQVLAAQAAISLRNSRVFETLEQRVRERTQELHEKNAELESTLAHLKEAQQRMVVQERLASLGAMTAGIAHELRNPLNFINNFASLSERKLAQLVEQIAVYERAQDQRAGAGLQRLIGVLTSNLQKISEHGARIDSIIQSMLQHSRADVGLERPTDINDLVLSSVNLARGGLRAKGAVGDVAVSVDLDPSVPRLKVAPQSLGRSLLNLIENAYQAVLSRKESSEAGRFKPAICVSTRNQETAIEIAVADNGPGIPEEIGDKIFNPFFTTKPPGSGTGLGLWICHDIVVQAGGTLSFSSRVGAGTEFVMRLPKAGDSGTMAGRR